MPFSADNAIRSQLNYSWQLFIWCNSYTYLTMCWHAVLAVFYSVGLFKSEKKGKRSVASPRRLCVFIILSCGQNCVRFIERSLFCMAKQTMTIEMMAEVKSGHLTLLYDFMNHWLIGLPEETLKAAVLPQREDWAMQQWSNPAINPHVRSCNSDNCSIPGCQNGFLNG